MFHYLFSFRGRINRAKQWGFFLISIAIGIVEITLINAFLGLGNLIQVLSRKAPVTTLTENRNFAALCAALALIYVLALYMRLAVTTKRLHDRDKSAWWLLVFIVLPLVLYMPRFVATAQMLQHMGELIRNAAAHRPMMPGGPLAILASGAAAIISLWAFVELYCLRGSVGDNRFGPDPLAGRG